MKWLRWGVIALLALVVASVGVGIWQINEIATQVVEDQGKKALGVDTTIDFISLGFLPPSLRIGGFEIENPEGFAERNFVTVRRGALKTHMNSLFQETIVAPYLHLDGLELAIERGVRSSNYGVILDNLKKSDSGKDSAPPEASGGPGKRFRIDEIVIRDARATVTLGAAGHTQTIKTRVPEIRLQGVGSDGGVGAGEVINAIVVGLLESLARQGGLPADLAGDMLGNLKGLHRVGYKVSGDIVRSGGDLLDAGSDKAGDTVGAAGDAAGDAAGAAGDAAGDAAGAAGDAARKSGRGLRKLIPGRD
jgi:hypothetical protein